MKTNEWKGKKVLILGLGQFPKGSGVSAAVYVAKQGAEVLATDMKTEKEIEANVKRLRAFKNVSFRLGEHRLEDVEWADVIIRNPRVRVTSPEMQLATRLGKRVESDVSLFLARCPAKVVGITGTRGKSTTTTLVYEMLKASGKTVWLGGNILISPLTFVDKVKKDDTVVLELSSWLLETTGAVGLSPQISCITNMMRDHLNSYSGMEDYAEAKAQIFRHQKPEDVVVLNGDDAYGKGWISEAPGSVRIFTAKKKKGSAGYLSKTGFVIEEKELATFSEAKLFGEHNYRNILAACLTAKAAGATVAGIRKTIKSFKGLPDRQELLGKIRGVDFINDTTATTPDGTVAAVKALAPRYAKLHLIIGGNDKELDYAEFAKTLKKYRVDAVLLPGNAKEKILAELKKAKLAVEETETLKEAVDRLFARAMKGEALVLSPGATSFGQFKNEFDRGEAFQKIFKSIDGKAKKR